MVSTIYIKLKAYYKLDDTGNTITDAMDVNDGTNSNMTAEVTGKINTGYENNDDDDYISLPIKTQTPYSISLWFYPKSYGAANNSSILGGGTSKYFELFNGYEGGSADKPLVLRHSQNGGNISTSSDFSLNSWYHIVLTCDTEGNAKIYVNNKEEASGNIGNKIDTENALRLGGNRAIETSHGVYDEVGRWDKELNIQEISDLYNKKNGLEFSEFNVLDSGGMRTKTIATKYPVTKGLVAVNTKQKGVQRNLVSKGLKGLKSTMSKRYMVGV